jgi:hypothetical protein
MRVLAISVVVALLTSSESDAVSYQESQQHPLREKITVENTGDTTVDITLINPNTGSSVSGNLLVLDTFVNHTFIVHPTPVDVQRSDDLSPAESSVLQQMPTNNLFEDTIETVSDQGRNPTVESMTESCRQEYHDDVTNLIQCIEDKTAEKLIELNEELAFQRDLRRTIASLNENYTCTDLTRRTTKPKRTTTWSYNEGSNAEPIIRNVGILHEHRASQIHVIEDFISMEECDAIQAMAEPLLHRGTVADGKGGSTMSPNRKAWQAGIAVDDYYNAKDPIANVKRRLFAYTNHAVPYNLTLDGQEELMSIQYFGINSTAPRATSDHDHTILSTPDRYTPHCDGDCNDMLHKKGSRIATMVMYCTIPEESGGTGGGGTNFQEANVYVQPKVGSSVFFSYMDPVTLIHDEGYTTHSGCPVVYGTKRIVVQWMRYGVDTENPWDSFDTNNIKIKSNTF